MSEKTVVITGANRGIGLELVKRNREAGRKVYALCRKSSAELSEMGAQVIEGIDVTDLDELKKARGQVEGPIDLLICNAGVLQTETLEDLKSINEKALNSIRKQFEVNTLGPIKTLSCFLDKLKEGSKVAMMTSRMGSIEDNTSGGRYGYRLSKGALNNVGRSLAFDLKGEGIALGLFHPGWVQTEMTGKTGHLTAKESSQKLYQRMEELSLENTSSFWHPDGQILPW